MGELLQKPSQEYFNGETTLRELAPVAGANIMHLPVDLYDQIFGSNKSDQRVRKIVRDATQGIAWPYDAMASKCETTVELLNEGIKFSPQDGLTIDPRKIDYLKPDGEIQPLAEVGTRNLLQQLYKVFEGYTDEEGIPFMRRSEDETEPGNPYAPIHRTYEIWVDGFMYRYVQEVGTDRTPHLIELGMCPDRRV